MSQVLSLRIQELLRRRLGDVGVAPDLRNDDPAIDAVCKELQIGREQVARELDEMRMHVAKSVLGADCSWIGALAARPVLRRATQPSAADSPEYEPGAHADAKLRHAIAQAKP